MIKQINNLEVKRVDTIFEEVSLKAFLVNNFAGAHIPVVSPNVTMRVYIMKMGEKQCTLEVSQGRHRDR
jgi:hypothetical protein